MYSSTKVGNLKRHLLQKHNITINDVKVSNSVGFGIFENRMDNDENSTKQCDKCTYSTSKTYNLSRHLLTKHSNENILNNKACVHCSYVAARPAHLTPHLN